MKKCPYCQELIQDEAIKCRFCGSFLNQPPHYAYNNTNQQQQQNNSSSSSNNVFDCGPEGKSRGVFAILAILLGGLGIQYFYVGKNTAGIIVLVLTLLTCGFWCAVWSILTIIQGVLVFTQTDEEFRQKFILSDKTFPIF